MKKLVKFAAVLAALTLSLGFMSCDQNAPETPATGNETTDNGTNTGNTDNTDADDADDVDPVVLWESTEGLELAWGYTIIEADKIASATNDSVLEFSVTKCADDYQVIQICLADNSQIVAGVVTNATINSDGNGFIPSFETETFTYKPTAEEWAQLKTDGIRFQGHGIKVTKLLLK